MAKVFRLDDGTKPPPASERIVLEALSRLPDEWHVFHSVRWQSHRHGRQGDGEADFVLVHRQRGVLVIEVKGGEIRIERGRWLSTDRQRREHEIRNPFSQASDSKHALIRFLAELEPPLDGVRVGHAVVFPSVDFNGSLGPAAPRDITLYAADLVDPIAAIDGVFQHWDLDREFSAPNLERIVALLAPTVEVRRTLKVDVVRSEAELVRLTFEQQRLFGNLRGVRRLIATGGPGTGKTLLALAHARALVAQGFRTRLVCYNELLGRELAKSVQGQSGIEASTFHALCVREASQAGLPIPANPSQVWWDEEAPTLLATAISRRGPSIDALIVDEGQDFAPSWFRALASDLVDSEDGPFYVFADARQELRRREWRSGVPIVGEYALSENCRNTLPIAQRLNALYSEDGPDRGADGAAPAIVGFSPGDDVLTMVLELAERLLDEQGLSPEDLTLLCDDPALVHRLRETYVSERPVVGYGGRGVACETIARFKGLEAPAILMILTDAGDAGRDRTSTAYVGLSRARSAAIVLAREGHPMLDAFERVRQRR